RDAADEAIGIVRRRAVEREHAAGFRIERDRAALQRIGEQGRGVLLQLEVDVRVERRTGLGQQVLSRAGFTHDAPAGIYLHEADALRAAQRILVLLFEAALAYLLAGFVSAIVRRRELGFGDFADVSHEGRDRGAVRIVAFGRRLNDQPWKLYARLLEHRDDVERRVRQHDGGAIRCAPIPPNGKVDLFRAERD